MNKVLLVLLMTCSVSWMASAQVQFSFTSDSLSAPGGFVDIDVNISGFDEIIGMQLSFNWDPSAFSYEDILDVTEDLDEFSRSSLGTPDEAVAVDDGELTLTWSGPLTEPRSLPDGTKLFTLRLRGSGALCSSTTLTVSDTPRQREAVNNDFEELDITSVGGNIAIIDSSCPDNGGGGGGGGGGTTDGFSFSFDNIAGAQGSTICIPVRANNFEDVFSFQSQFTWDPSVLRFTELMEGGLTSINLNELNSDQGVINVVWLFDREAVTLADGSALFELCFEVVGSGGNTTTLNMVGDDSFPLEISTGSGSITEVDVTPLSFTVGGGGGGGNQSGVGLIAGEIFTEGAGNICIPITTRDFTSIGAFQAGLTFDESVLRYTGINQGGLSGVDIGDTEADQGQLRILWQADFSTPSVTLDDNTVLFELCFDVIGADGASSNIAFANFPPFNIEFSSEIGQSVEFFTQDGSITVGSDTGGGGGGGNDDFTLSISSASANPNQVVCVDVTTQGFDNIQGMGFAFGWDPSIITFTEVRNINLPGLGESSFAPQGSDRLNLLYNPPSAQSVADGTRLFQLCFTTSATCDGSSSAISFVAGNVPIEIVGAGNEVLDPTLNNGQITCTGNTGGGDLAVSVTNIMQPTCNNGTNGSVTLQFEDAVGAVSCLWVNDDTGLQVTLNCNLNAARAGNYTLTASDASGAEVTTSVSLVDPPMINLMETFAGDPCTGTGQISVAISGGTSSNGTYDISWSGGLPSSSVVSNLGPGTYRITVTDDNGCTVVEDYVLEGTDLSGVTDPVVVNNTNPDSPNGSIDLRPSVGGLTYLWSTGETTSAINGLAAGNYSVRVTEDSGCFVDLGPFTIVDEVALSGADLINSVISRYNGFGVSCNGESDGIMDGSVVGACDEGPAQIFINGTEVTLPAMNLPAGMHVLRIEDACGAVFEEAFFIEEPDAITLAGDIEAIECPMPLTANNGIFRLPIEGGTGTYTITPSVGMQESGTTLTGMTIEPFTAVIQDENGCQVMFQDLRLPTGICTGDDEPVDPNLCDGRPIISPNGDRVNDTFLIPCVADQANQPNILSIYDRWGNLVMEADNYDNSWAGTDMDGEPLPEGGYMWVLRTETPGQRDLFRGTVSILR